MTSADSAKNTLVNMGIQSHGGYKGGFATLWLAPYPLFVGLLLRNLKRALNNNGARTEQNPIP